MQRRLDSDGKDSDGKAAGRKTAGRKTAAEGGDERRPRCERCARACGRARRARPNTSAP